MFESHEQCYRKATKEWKFVNDEENRWNIILKIGNAIAVRKSDDWDEGTNNNTY